MSVFLTPDLKPFYGGTYFPPEDKWGQPGFKRVLLRIAELWQKEHEKIMESSETVARQMQEISAPARATAAKLDAKLLDNAYQQLAAQYEPVYGGFGNAPNFPHPVTLNFILRYWARANKKEALDMTLHTLRKMADGGMHDHLGGGFHRYSVDARWHVPHFEKMLYDQAQLTCSYLEAFQITRDPFFADVARDILDYVLRDMTGEDGSFFSAEDADSPLPTDPNKHAEGAFYVWGKKEIEQALGTEAADVFCYHYGVQENGNAETDPHGEFTNKNILIVSHSIEETATQFSKTPDEVRSTLRASRATLFAVRANRPRPHLDDKTLTAWNGLMISAFARAAQVLDAARQSTDVKTTAIPADNSATAYLSAATRAAEFIEKNLYDRKSGTLLRRYRDGQAAIDGYADDYTFLIQGLLDLYEASFDARWLTWAVALQKKQNKLFWDRQGGYFTTSGDDLSVLLRMKEDYDGAEPSPNSVAALNLLRLSQMIDPDRGGAEFRQMAELTLAAFGARLEQIPTALPQMLCALEFSLSKPKQIVIAGKPGAPDTRALLRVVHERFIPDKILLVADGGAGQKTLAQFLPSLDSVTMKDGKATAYVCENYTCRLPTNDAAEMAKLLQAK
jgi:uncharacterized protein YyaL (SSP411 family)